MARSNFSVSFKVRDYECDQQGIVNNAVYLHYFEHARHEYLEQSGLNFKQLIDEGIFLIVPEIYIQYKRSLKSGEQFTIDCTPQLLSSYRIQFDQNLFNAKGEKMTIATTIVAGVDRNQKLICIDKIFEKM